MKIAKIIIICVTILLVIGAGLWVYFDITSDTQTTNNTNDTPAPTVFDVIATETPITTKQLDETQKQQDDKQIEIEKIIKEIELIEKELNNND